LAQVLARNIPIKGLGFTVNPVQPKGKEEGFQRLGGKGKEPMVITEGEEHSRGGGGLTIAKPTLMGGVT